MLTMAAHVTVLITLTTIALSVRSNTAILESTANNGFNCTFDQDMCGWTQAQNNDFDWERHLVDTIHHTTADGYNMWINTKDYQDSQAAKLVSPVVNITNNQEKCFQFSYLMHGPKMGTLTMYLSTDGTSYKPVWSRTDNQGIFLLHGQVSIAQSGQIFIEGVGTSGNDGEIAIDNVALKDGPCTSQAAVHSVNSLTCDFELDLCGYADTPWNDNGWHRSFADSEMAEDSFDHTTKTAEGAFMTVDAKNFNVQSSLTSTNITTQGSYCISFFYRKRGENTGLLSVSVTVHSINAVIQMWKDQVDSPEYQWNVAQFSLNISSVIQLSFDAALPSGYGDLSLDDISVSNGTCETPPNCSFDRYDLCSWINDIDDFDWEICTSDSDAQVFAPYVDADDNVQGGFILLDMANNPNNREAYLISEVITVRGSQCFSFYYYPMIKSDAFDNVPLWLNIYVATGTDFPGTLYWTYSMANESTKFLPGKLPLQMNLDYRLVIGGFVSLGQVLSMDKFSLFTFNCSYTPAEAKPSAQTVQPTTTAITKLSQPPSTTGPHSLWDCDFETDSCHWKSSQTANSTWTRRQPGYYLNGPHFDHTFGPGGTGYFLTLDTRSGKLQTDTPLKAGTNNCLMFWLYLYGSSDFEFTVQTMANSSTTLMYKSDSMGTDWHQMILNLPIYTTSYNVQFIYEQKSPGGRNQLALDDIHISGGKCSLEAGPSCTFDRGFCNWGNTKASDFNFTLNPTNDQDSGIQSDHTTETNMGSFIRAATDGHSQGQKAHFQSQKLAFSGSVCMRFYYFITLLCDSELTIETLGSQDKHSVPLLGLQDIVFEAWQLGEVTIYDPDGTQVIFTVTVGQNKSCEIGLDDVTFLYGECQYTGTTDFENGFDTFHNVYSNDFNWVIASPSDGIYAWLPSVDYSTNSPTGHFAVASFNSNSSSGKKAELWGQLSPPMNSFCTSFYIYVHGSDPGILNVTIVDYLDDTRIVVWSYTPAPGTGDSQIYAQFPHVYSGQFYVVFSVILGSDGNWAIDSIETFPSIVCKVMPAQAAASTVPPPTTPAPFTTQPFSHQSYAECDFEINLCNWSIPGYSDINWNRTSGDSGGQFTPTQGRPGGGKFFLTLPKSLPGKTAILQSPAFNMQPLGGGAQRQFNFRFWLNMQGEHIGHFTVELQTKAVDMTILFISSPTDSWEQISFVVPADEPFSLTFQGVSGTDDSISIDDIEVGNSTVGDYDTVYKCSFESSDLCGFKQDSSNDINWQWRGGPYDTLISDHTTSTSAGHAVVVSQSQGKPGDIARLISKTVAPISGCLTLWLLIASDGAAFRIYISSAQQEELIVQKINTQGYVWVKSQTPVSSNVPFTIILEAEVLANRTADLIVDDFQLSRTACDTQGTCTFERDMCAWQNSLISGPDFDWIRGTGNTVGITGPSVDSTTGSPDGYYLYIDSSGPYKYQDKAWLDSATFPKATQCLHFHYYMSGVSVGTLNVYTNVLDSDKSVLVWSLSGDQGNYWQTAMVTVGTTQDNYYVRLEGALGFSMVSNIAIDDIVFLPDACDTQPPQANALNVMTTIPTTTAARQRTHVLLQRCVFDNTTCGYSNAPPPFENIWVLSGPNMTVSDTLKPFNGHTSNDTNTFIYLQVGGNLKENATARFVSQTYPVYNSEPKCLEFFYHMNGDQVGQLSVYIAPNGQENSLSSDMRLWSQNFDAGPGWKKGRVPILQSANYHIIFEGIRSKVDYYYGVDDLGIYDNECVPPEICDFEDDTCLWSNEGGETDSKFYWTRYQPSERTAMFAPTVDHTRQTVSGYYMLVESSLENAGSVARLYSQPFGGSSSPYCFHFWYYLYGHNLGSLKVLVRNRLSSTSSYSDADLWELDNPTGDGWFQAQVNISQTYTIKPFMVIIEATVGSTLQGAIGVDDTQFEIAECGTRPTGAIVTANALMVPDCNFEDGDTCDWTSLPNEEYTFTVGSSGDAIPYDHSGGSGKFLLADSKKVPQNMVVFIQSPLLPPTFGTSCLTLWYNMQVTGMSQLSLISNTDGSVATLWEANPEESDEWLSVRINIQNNFDYQLLLKATTGTFDAGSVAVDDISLVHGACPRTERINFEEGLSGFSSTTSTSIKWVPQVANYSFVQFDHTYHTPIGHVLQADLGSATMNLKIAEIQSPLYPSVGDECMEFWYAKNGSSGGWLSVTISENGPGFVAGDADPVWVTTADTNNVWKRALVDISSEYPYWIIFQAAANSSQVNDIIVIDDISFRVNSCPSVVNCDFDLNSCDYVSRRNGSVYWQTMKGVYPDSLMPFDQTTQSDQGMYIEVNFPSTLNTYTVDFISPIEMQLTSKCLIFWYYGSGEGSLQVFAQTSSNQRQSLVTKTILTDLIETRQYRRWENVQVDVASTTPYSIVFEAKNQKSDTSFAVDSIQLLNGTCASLKREQQSSSTSVLDPKKAFLGCDFENSNFCNFTSGGSGTISWKMFSFDSRHSSRTGVDFDHTKSNKYGHHVYMDASGQKFNTTAILISPSFINDKYICLSFYYAMYGRDVNRLNVYVAQNQENTLYWTRSDNQGEGWHHQMVEIGESPQPTQVIFEGFVGHSDESDIDLDDIWIFYGKCPPPEYCDFEDSEICKMDQDNLDDFHWVIQLAALATGSDPKIDHTYGTDLGHYLLLDMSGTKTDDESRIFTQQYNADSARCLSFWFHFTNTSSNSHTLTVSLQDERGIGTTLIVLRGFFKDDWSLAVFPLKPTENFQIVFIGQSSGSLGNIALDDIVVSPNECESYVDCDFESHDMCGWELIPDYSTPPWEVIPPNHYMTLNFSDEQNNVIEVSKVHSLIIPPGIDQQFCFTFNYMMYGSNVGYLNISLEVDYPEPQTIVIFSIYGDQGKDTWHYASGDNPQMYFGIARFVITGSTAAASNNNIKTAVILVSDILVALQPCSEWVTQKEGYYGCSASSQIPLSSVCDFIPDCIGGVDELNCGSCDFENGYCNWQDDSTGAQEFMAVSAIPNSVFTDSHPSKFLTIERAEGIPGGTGDLVLNQEIGPSPYNCTVVFSYYMSLESQSRYGNLYVSVEENNDETVVWESSEENVTTWQTASVDIGSIHTRFKIHFASKYLPFDNAMGIDDIKFQGCSFAAVSNGTCATGYTCRRTGACIDSTTKFCDYTDECGDSSDEDPAICGDYLMDNFEDSFGDWSQDDNDDFDWSRHSGSWISSSSGPRRDHTLGTRFGHYLIFEGGAHNDGQVARLISPEFLPTQNSDCKIRFYYHMHGSDKGLLTLYISSKTSGKMQQISQYVTKLNDAWLFSSSTLTSSDNFQVVFEGKVVGPHSTDTGLDDITFTPQCQLKNPSSHRPGTSSVRTTNSGTTRKPTTISYATKNQVSTEKQPLKEGIPADENSGSWKVPVGVVLGLLAFVAVIVGVVIYLKRTHKLNWVAFPLLRRGITIASGESNPAFNYDAAGNTSIPMSEKVPISGSIQEIFGESTELNVISSSGTGLSNPLYVQP